MEETLNLETITKALANYDIGEIEGTPEQLRGDVDLNYKITTTRGVYLLKYIVNKPNLPQFKILGSLHEYLIGKGVPVPKIYKTKSGNYVEGEFILYEFIEGETKNEWTREEITSLTTNFAKMLVALKDYEVPEFIKNKDDKYTKGYNIKYCYEVFRPRIEELETFFEVKDSILKTIDTLYGKLSEFEELPKYFVHGDLNEMNAIFKDGENVGIIDIGGSHDPIVYDLGEYIYWYTMPVWTEEFNNERCDLIVNAFEVVVPLSMEEKELLPYMILRRGIMDIMLTLHYYWENEGKVPLLEDRLKVLTNRNNKIMDLIKQ